MIKSAAFQSFVLAQRIDADQLANALKAAKGRATLITTGRERESFRRHKKDGVVMTENGKTYSLPDGPEAEFLALDDLLSKREKEGKETGYSVTVNTYPANRLGTWLYRMSADGRAEIQAAKAKAAKAKAVPALPAKAA